MEQRNSQWKRNASTVLQFNVGLLVAFRCTVQPAVQLSGSDYSCLGLCVHPATRRLRLQHCSHYSHNPSATQYTTTEPHGTGHGLAGF